MDVVVTDFAVLLSCPSSESVSFSNENGYDYLRSSCDSNSPRIFEHYDRTAGRVSCWPCLCGCSCIL